MNQIIHKDCHCRRGAAIPKRKGEFRAALAVFRRKMEAGADKTESQLAEGKHTFLKKVDENFSDFVRINNLNVVNFER